MMLRLFMSAAGQAGQARQRGEQGAPLGTQRCGWAGSAGRCGVAQNSKHTWDLSGRGSRADHHRPAGSSLWPSSHAAALREGFLQLHDGGWGCN